MPALAHDRPFGLFADACAVGVSKLHGKQYITVSRILPYMKGNNQSDAVKHNRNIAYPDATTARPDTVH